MRQIVIRDTTEVEEFIQVHISIYRVVNSFYLQRIERV